MVGAEVGAEIGIEVGQVESPPRRRIGICPDAISALRASFLASFSAACASCRA